MYVARGGTEVLRSMGWSAKMKVLLWLLRTAATSTSAEESITAA